MVLKSINCNLHGSTMQVTTQDERLDFFSSPYYIGRGCCFGQNKMRGRVKSDGNKIDKPVAGVTNKYL